MQRNIFITLRRSFDILTDFKKEGFQFYPYMYFCPQLNFNLIFFIFASGASKGRISLILALIQV